MYKQITILTVLICFLAAPALAAQMSVEPVYQEASQGDNITVNITVDPEGSEVYGASYILYFNNTVLNATSFAKGPFLSQDGNPSNILESQTGINNTAGEIAYVEYKTGEVPGVTGYGVLTTITFQVIGEEGTSQLNMGDLDGALLCSGYPLFQAIPTTVNNGSVEVRKGVCGDVTGDGYVRVSDGIRIIANQTFVGDPQYFVDPWIADVTGDGYVRVSDGIRIIANQTFVGNPDYFLNCG